MPGDARSDIKLGFYIGVGLLILALVLAVLQVILGKVTKAA